LLKFFFKAKNQKMRRREIKIILPVQLKKLALVASLFGFRVEFIGRIIILALASLETNN